MSALKFGVLCAAVAALGVNVITPTATLASTCSISDVTTSTVCAVESGNNENQNLNTIVSGGLFGITNWSEVSHALDLDTPANNFGPLNATGAGTQSGNWSVPDFGGFADAILVVKGGDGFDAYLLDTLFTSGTWSTLGLTVGNGNHPGLSHLALYEGGLQTSDASPPLDPTPIPGALWLFGSVIAGAAGFQKMRKRRLLVAQLATT